MTIIERLEHINQNIVGDVIVLGGMSKYLNGYRNEQPSGLIDISVKSESTSSLETLGKRCDIEGGTTFLDPVKDQFVLRTEDYGFDVFVQDEPTDTTIIGSLQVLTPQGDLNWHMDMSSSIQSEYLHNKVQSLKELYGL